MRDVILHTAEGMLSGAIGTKIMELELGQAGKLPEHLRPTQPSDHPGKFIARKLAGERLSEAQLDTAGNVLHWAYGVSWGALLGALSRKLSMRSLPTALLAGAGFGAIVWAVGYAGWLPATKLTAPAHRQGAGHAGASLLGHIGYGLATAVPLWGMRMLEEKLR